MGTFQRDKQVKGVSSHRETAAQRGKVTYLKSHSPLDAELVAKSGLLTARLMACLPLPLLKFSALHLAASMEVLLPHHSHSLGPEIRILARIWTLTVEPKGTFDP